jgi:uncharacterized protein YbjT (DUF2867 family)
MARVLIVGCGCRGRALAADLVADGHAVRGTTRDPGRAEAIADTGAEPWVGDPARLGTLTRALDSVTVVCWLLGAARGSPAELAELRERRLAAYLQEMVDTTVRGFVHDAGAGGPDDLAARERAVVEHAARTWLIPVRAIEADPADPAGWGRAARAAIDSLLEAPEAARPGPLDSPPGHEKAQNR